MLPNIHPDSELQSADAVYMLVAMGVPLEYRYLDWDDADWYRVDPEWIHHDRDRNDIWCNDPVFFRHVRV